MRKLRKGDTVQVIKGKDTGKKGKIITIFTAEGRALVEGINMLKKHKRKSRQDQQGGIVSIEAPIALANIMFLCKRCNRPSKLGVTIAKDGSRNRFCKACKETV
jgi:large subunit ribosomal protein L24